MPGEIAAGFIAIARAGDFWRCLGAAYFLPLFRSHYAENAMIGKMPISQGAV
jgi:hypothetical protein